MARAVRALIWITQFDASGSTAGYKVSGEVVQLAAGTQTYRRDLRDAGACKAVPTSPSALDAVVLEQVPVPPDFVGPLAPASV